MLLFLLSAAALPDEVPPDGVDLKEYYRANGAYFWTLLTALMVWSILTHAVEALRDGGSLNSFLQDRPVDLAISAAFASLIFVRRRWWNGLVLAVALLGPVEWLSRSIG